MAGSECGDHALELAGADHARVAHRVLVHDRALADVGNDLGLLACAAGDIASRGKTVLVERLDRSEAIAEAIGSISRIERPPHLTPAARVVVARFGSAEADHGLIRSQSRFRTLESSYKIRIVTIQSRHDPINMNHHVNQFEGS